MRKLTWPQDAGKAALRISVLHVRVAHLARLALNQGSDKMAIELAEVRTELSDIFELIRPEQKESHE